MKYKAGGGKFLIVELSGRDFVKRAYTCTRKLLTSISE